MYKILLSNILLFICIVLYQPGSAQQAIVIDSTISFSVKKEPVNAPKGYTRLPTIKTTTEKNTDPKITGVPNERYASTEKPTSPSDQTNHQQKYTVPETGSAEKTIGTGQEISSERIYPDLQVTATQESPQTPVFYGKERLPETVLDKKEPTAPVEKFSAQDKKTTSTIGKVSFLKQYAAELKMQNENNKNNTNYPLEEKQLELKQLEDLLRGE